MGKKPLKIYVGGVPPGVRVAVFDTRFDQDSEQRTIFNEEAGPEGCIEKEIDPSLGGVRVKVVIRSAGFLLHEYTDTIQDGIGLFHAARMELDGNYSGKQHEIPTGWNAMVEHRKAGGGGSGEVPALPQRQSPS